MWWLNKALLNLAEDPSNWNPGKDPKRKLEGFKTLLALPLAGGIGAAHAKNGILTEENSKSLLAMTSSYLHMYANMV